LLAASLHACDRAGKLETRGCPAGTKEVEEDYTRIKWRFCERPDGQRHGPVFEVHSDGRSRPLGQMVNGRREGRWTDWNVDGSPLAEFHWHEGLLDGRSVLWVAEGRPALEVYWKAGLAHGTSTGWRTGHKSSERNFHHGLRHGTWRRYAEDGRVIETRTYDEQGILVGVDDRAVPLPVERITLPEGRSIVRRDCGPMNRESGSHSSCLDLFEAYQRCMSAKHAEACRKVAIEQYLQPGSSDW